MNKTKPWEKYYVSLPSYIDKLASSTMYEAYTNANKDNLDSLAVITEDGSYSYTHRELITLCDLAAAGFSKIGIKQGSRVGFISNHSVEEIVAMLALNKLGAVSVFLDYSKSISDIYARISKCGVDLLLIDETFLKMEPLVNRQNLPIIIINQTKPYTKGIPFIDLYRIGDGIHVSPVPFSPHKLSVIINSSGTTGQPKPITHTDYSVNMAAYNVLRTNYPLTRNNFILKAIPSFIGLGLITTLYTALLSGTRIVLIRGNSLPQWLVHTLSFIRDFPLFRDELQFDASSQLLIFAAPIFYRKIYENINHYDDLSHIGAMLAAGSKMNASELDAINQKLKEKNCAVSICNGYGQNEMCGAVTLNSNSANRNGSAGFPVAGANIKIVDPDTLDELNNGQTGLILEQCNSEFLNYENLPAETESAYLQLSDGSRWFNTKDLGNLDSDGFLYVTGRVSRVLVRCDFKISIDSIEEKIKLHPAVQECAVISETDNGVDNYPVAYVKLDSRYQTYASAVLKEIQEGPNALSLLECPSKIIEVTELPYMKSGKVDYLALSRLHHK